MCIMYEQLELCCGQAEPSKNKSSSKKKIWTPSFNFMDLYLH